MNPEERKSIKLELDAYVYLMKKLQRLASQIERAASKKKQQREAREIELLEYKTEQEIQDAYGWSIITNEERERLLDKLQGTKEKVAFPTKESIALDELRSILKTIYHMKNDLEYELMSEEDKQLRCKSSEEWQSKIAEIRAKKGGIPCLKSTTKQFAP